MSGYFYNLYNIPADILMERVLESLITNLPTTAKPPLNQAPECVIVPVKKVRFILDVQEPQKNKIVSIKT